VGEIGGEVFGVVQEIGDFLHGKYFQDLFHINSEIIIYKVF